jgi:hypothetical protein
MKPGKLAHCLGRSPLDIAYLINSTTQPKKERKKAQIPTE